MKLARRRPLVRLQRWRREFDGGDESSKGKPTVEEDSFSFLIFLPIFSSDFQ